MDRQRIRIPLLGLDLSSSDHIAPAGSMQDIHNIRYTNGSWENVGDLNTPDTNTFDSAKAPRIVGDDQWTVRHYMENGSTIPIMLATKYEGITAFVASVYVYKGELKVTQSLQGGLSLDCDPGEVRFFSFGKVLYINSPDQEHTYILRGEVFMKIDLGSLQPPSLTIGDLSIKEVLPPSGKWDNWDNVERIYWYDDNLSITGGIPKGKKLDVNYLPICTVMDDSSEAKTNYYNIPKAQATDDDRIMGTMSVFLAYELFDGTIIKPSRPLMIDSFASWSGFVYYDIKQNGDGVRYRRYLSKFYSAKPALKIAIGTSLKEHPLIKKVVVFSTRTKMPMNFDNIDRQFSEKSKYSQKHGEYVCYNAAYVTGSTRTSSAGDVMKCHASYFKSKEEPEDQVYYNIASVDCSDGDATLELSYKEHYKNIEHQPPYHPNQSIHAYASIGKFEYNDRLHSHGSTHKLYQGYSAFIGQEYRPMLDAQYKIVNTVTEPSFKMFTDIYLNIDGKEHVVRVIQPYLAFYSDWDAEGMISHFTTPFIYNKQVYPDARAYKMIVRIVRPTYPDIENSRIYDIYAIKAISLTPDYANNLAVGVVNTSSLSDTIKLTPDAENSPNVQRKVLLRPVSDTYADYNILRVSHPGNPFVINLENVYAVGTSGGRIERLATTADQLSETRFGEFPLLAFTSDGLWVLEQSPSGQILYSSIKPLSSDVIMPDTNTVSHSNVLFFVNTKGLHALHGREVVCISRKLENNIGSIGKVPFVEYIKKGAFLVCDYIHDEIIIFNNQYNYAYVYSVLCREFYTRDFNGVRYINSPRYLYYRGHGLHTIGDETSTAPGKVALLTRPLNLGNTELKRVETAIVRHRRGDNSSILIKIEASNDLNKWNLVHSATNCACMRRFAASYIYYRISIELQANTPISISCFDVEFYNKFMGRLR